MGDLLRCEPPVTVGMWFTEKKKKKINMALLKTLCRERGVILKELDISRCLEEQLPFSVFFHRMWLLLADAECLQAQAISKVNNVECFLRSHPEVMVLEPLSSVKQLLRRARYYSIIQASHLCQEGNIFVPKFTTLNDGDMEEKLKEAGVTFPCVCKPALSPGCHEMNVVFSAEGLSGMSRPCVAQSFINHNALLYKLFVCGDKHFVTTRPSIKNFFNTDGDACISFHSHDVSKSSSCSPLIEMDPMDRVNDLGAPSPEVISNLGHSLRHILGLDLFGVDIVQEVNTSHLAIIDVNFFPSYEGMTDFIPGLADLVVGVAKKSQDFASTNQVNNEL